MRSMRRPGRTIALAAGVAFALLVLAMVAPDARRGGRRPRPPAATPSCASRTTRWLRARRSHSVVVIRGNAVIGGTVSAASSWSAATPRSSRRPSWAPARIGADLERRRGRRPSHHRTGRHHPRQDHPGRGVPPGRPAAGRSVGRGRAADRGRRRLVAAPVPADRRAGRVGALPPIRRAGQRARAPGVLAVARLGSSGCSWSACCWSSLPSPSSGSSWSCRPAIALPAVLLFCFVGVAALLGRLILSSSERYRDNIVVTAVVGACPRESRCRSCLWSGARALVATAAGFGAALILVNEWRQARRTSPGRPAAPCRRRRAGAAPPGWTPPRRLGAPPGWAPPGAPPPGWAPPQEEPHAQGWPPPPAGWTAPPGWPHRHPAGRRRSRWTPPVAQPPPVAQAPGRAGAARAAVGGRERRRPRRLRAGADRATRARGTAGVIGARGEGRRGRATPPLAARPCFPLAGLASGREPPELDSQRRLELGVATARMPALSSRSGTTRWPPSSMTSPISPNIARTAPAGRGTTAGRRSTRPSVFTNSRLVTGIGARDVHGAVDRLGEEQVGDGADQVVEADPAQPLVAGAERAAGAGAKGRQHAPEGAAGRREHDAEPHGHDPDAGAARRRAAPPPTRGRPRPGSRRRPRWTRSARRRRGRRRSSRPPTPRAVPGAAASWRPWCRPAAPCSGGGCS